MNTDDPRFELIRRCHDCVATAEELAQLEGFLRHDPEFRETYLRYWNLDLALSAAVNAPQRELRSLQPSTGQSRSRWLLWGPLTAAAAAVIALIWGLARDVQPVHPQERPRDTSAHTVATLLYSEGCEWQDGRTLTDGLPLESGALHLKRGMAVVRFVGGAEMALSGETSVELDSRGAVRVHRGKINVRINEAAIGFKVRTPSSDLTDLGTEFEVKVGERGETELHVLDGAVSYAQPGTRSENEPQVTAGKALRFAAKNNSSPQTIAFDALPFAEILRRANMEPREGDLLSYEPFDYVEGPLPLTQARGGNGWAGAWLVGRLADRSASDSGDMRIVSGRIRAPWPVEGGRRGMLEVDGGFDSRERTLAQPVRLDRDGIYYVSMMVRWEIPPEKLDSKESRFLSIALRSSSNYAGDRIALMLPPFLQPQLQTSDGFAFTSPAQVRVNEAQLWCAKIIARADGEDELSFRIYSEGESLDFAEPTIWSVTSRGTHSDAVLDLLVLAAGGSCTAWLDEVRVAKNWRSVMPRQLPNR